MYEDCVQAIWAYTHGSLGEIDIELVKMCIIPYLSPLSLKYNVVRNVEIFKEMFGSNHLEYILKMGRQSLCSTDLDPVWLSSKRLCKFLNRIFNSEPFEIHNFGIGGDVIFLKASDKGIFWEKENVIPFLNFLQKITSYDWVCYPHGLNIICCLNWSQVLKLTKDHIEGLDDSEIQEYVFSDETWNRLKEEQPDYTSVKRKSVYDE